jgi:hypothetical protein
MSRREEIVVLLERLTAEARRLPGDDRRDPDTYHEARSELGHALQMLGNRLNPRPMITAQAAQRQSARWPYE